MPALFVAVERIGGAAGWYSANWLWRLRGAIDRGFGGVGLRRGRRDPTGVRLGDPIDFWRVEELVPGSRLRLRAEMKVPGMAMLEFEVEASPDGKGAVLIQRAEFDPTGRWGRVYWAALRPIHDFVFRGMAAAIVRSAASGPDDHA